MAPETRNKLLLDMELLIYYVMIDRAGIIVELTVYTVNIIGPLSRIWSFVAAKRATKVINLLNGIDFGGDTS